MTDTLDTTTVAATVERQKLQRHFGRFDILFFLICTIVGVDTIATVAQGGGQAFTWMMVFAVVFFVPQALLFAELGSAFPQEGGPYYWTRLAFGHLAGAVNNFLYWITNPVWIGGTLDHHLHRRRPGLLQPRRERVHAGVATSSRSRSSGCRSSPPSCRSARPSGCRPRAPSPGSCCSGCSRSRSSSSRVKHGAHGLGASAYKPSESGFVLLVGVLLFNFVGFELPSSAGEEMTNPKRDVPFGIARSAVASVLLYALPVIGILIVLPSSAVTNFSGFVGAIKDVFTVYGGLSSPRTAPPP